MWDDVYDVMERRIRKAGHLEGSDGSKEFLLSQGMITRITDPKQIENPYKGKPASPYQRVLKRYKVEKYPWQELSLKQMVKELAENEQKSEIPNHAVCAGCGRDIEIAWVHLDHIQPKSDGGPNDISNRIIMCPHCNQIKKDSKTIPALWKHNVKTGWMKDKERAKHAREAAKECWKRVKITMEGKI